ncbi:MULTISPECIES: DNA internalization-related competence protein ComEC/Rec2 [unclassified Crossiella]|uniref:DNA internalization-related competence protein ComEC/Rec2 n=1 Tax=unclassified Crossiella TaxID=2620835 RepID=UPI0027E4E632|nr:MULTISPECIES: DNA internalization-related competence protein ComEC/Rec2 [unclassified Crossiella]
MVTGDPRPMRTPAYGGRPANSNGTVLTIALDTAHTTGDTLSVGGTVLLLAMHESWSDISPGQRLRTTGKLAPAHPGDLTAAALRVHNAPELLGTPPFWQRAATHIRAGLRQASSVLPADQAGLLPSLVVGDTTTLAPRVIADFRTAGLAHLLAVSGTNLAIVCGAVLLLCRALRTGPRTATAVAALALLGFVILARPQPSVLRAAVMAAIALYALTTGRDRAAIPALAGTVTILLLADPELAGDLGFLLSVLATAALVLLAPRWSDALRRRHVPSGLAEALAIPAAAHLFTAPVVVGMTGELSLTAILANLLAAPVVALATVLGVLAAALSVIHPGAAELLVHLTGPAMWWLVTVAHQAAAIPMATLPWPSGLGGAFLLIGVLIVLALVLRQRRFRVLLIAAALLALLVLVPIRALRPGWPLPDWAVVACDVDQGDAIVLATAEPGRAVLVDTGPDPIAITNCLRDLDIDRIPLLVLTHLHADHIGGLSEVLAGHQVGAVAISPVQQPPWAIKEIRRATESAGVPLTELRPGTSTSWPGLTIDILGPRSPAALGATGDRVGGTALNDASVVLRAHTTAGRVLLTGDIELAGQADLLADKGSELAADILKVPHHGSRYSLPRFLATVRPRIALISVGADNDYGHPSPLILETLRTQGTHILRTDQDGDLAIAPSPQGPVISRHGKQESRTPR